jgi:hypothetical protein
VQPRKQPRQLPPPPLLDRDREQRER